MYKYTKNSIWNFNNKEIYVCPKKNIRLSLIQETT